jgi:cytoskeletal protein CcmA (bactofilin family)
MFSKSKIHDPGPKTAPEAESRPSTEAPATARPTIEARPGAARSRAGASVLSADLTVVGNITTAGDVQIEGVLEGDIRAHLVTVGEGATIRGEIVAEDMVINGHVVGRVRGLKVRLTATARVEGDIIHKTIAIEAGAHFEGSVQRQEDPIGAAGGAGASGAGIPAPGA